MKKRSLAASLEELERIDSKVRAARENLDRVTREIVKAPARRLQVLSYLNSVEVKKQHTSPCSDCPWARKSVKGWLGVQTAEEWIASVHSEDRIECHTRRAGPKPGFHHFQCAGAAIFRSNVCKSPRDKSLLSLPRQKIIVFANNAEFLAHHGKKVFP